VTSETFLEASAARVSGSELGLINRLLADVDARGVKLNWGKGATPGVAGWYLVDGRPTGVWSLNANTESPSAKAYLQFYLADQAGRAGLGLLEQVGAELEKIPSLRAKISDARASDWRKYPSVYLVDVAGFPEREQALFDAVTALVDG
jgi:hypothetical protein